MSDKKHPLPPPIVRHIQPADLGSPPGLIACALCADYVLNKQAPEQSKPILLLSFWLSDGECHMDLAYAVDPSGLVELVEGTCDDTFACPKIDVAAVDNRFSTHVVDVDKKLLTGHEFIRMREALAGYLTEAAAWWYGQRSEPQKKTVPEGLTFAAPYKLRRDS